MVGSQISWVLVNPVQCFKTIVIEIGKFSINLLVFVFRKFYFTFMFKMWLLNNEIDDATFNIQTYLILTSTRTF